MFNISNPTGQEDSLCHYHRRDYHQHIPNSGHQYPYHLHIYSYSDNQHTQQGYIVVGYRGTFAFGRDMSDVKVNTDKDQL